jgi:hypothetical protein
MAGLPMAAPYCAPSKLKRDGRAVLISLSLLIATFSFAAPPDIDSIAPLALRPGASTELKIFGSNLGEASNLWVNFAATSESLGDGRWRITLPSDVSTGIGALRVYGSNGVSRLALVMIDDMPTVTESKTNKTRATAQTVELGTAIDGRCDELSYDWFKIRANKGQRVSIEVVAARLGSRLDSVLRVFNTAGKQIAQNDDAPGLRADSFVSFVAAADEDHFVELRDVNYSGNSEMFYRLRIGEFSLATTVFPAVVSPGGKQSFALAGPAGVVARTEARATNSSALSLMLRGPRGSTFARALISEQRQIIEREPNDKPAQAVPCSWTNGINGRFDQPNDRDCYEFSARKGDRLEFTAATRSLGAPCDAVLEIQSADGKTLARSNPVNADEGIVSHKFANDGRYRLIVEEANGASGASCVYHIDAQRAAGFALSLEEERFNVAPGKTLDLKVSITRGDYKGAVTLGLAGLDSFTWTNHVIGEGKSNATMKVTAPATLPPGSMHSFSVFGTSKRDGTEVQARASTAPALRRRFPQMLYVPIEWDGEVTLGIVAP